MERGRREFVRDSAVLLGASCLTGLEPLLAAPAASSWTIGCMNRPWTKWTFGETLAAVKAAGYSTIGLLTRTKTEPFIAAEATPEYLEGLKRQLAGSGLAANMGALRSRYDVPLEETLKSLRKEIDNAAFLGLRYVLTFGVDDPLQLDRYFQALKGRVTKAREAREAWEKASQEARDKGEAPPEFDDSGLGDEKKWLDEALEEAFRGVDLAALEKDWMNS